MLAMEMEMARVQECMRGLVEAGDASVAAHFLPIMRQVRMRGGRGKGVGV